jgi:long-subunit fatty acid transport protein
MFIRLYLPRLIIIRNILAAHLNQQGGGNMKKLQLATSLTAAALTLSATTHASMGNLATTYGLLPSDMATAQSFSLFNTQASAAYYNPASLASSEHSEITLGILNASPSLTAVSNGGANPPVRTGDVLNNTQTESVLVGMKTNLTSLTKFKKPVYLGLIAGVEHYGLEMLAFESSTSKEGQFMQYGQKPLFVAASGGMEVIPGLNLGAGARITLHANASMSLESDLGGNTSNEELNVNATPILIPLLGVTADLDKLLCSGQSACWAEGISAAVSVRGKSNTQTTVEANAVIPGTIPEPGLPLNLKTLDAYQPIIVSTGVEYQLGEQLDLAATFEYQNWSSLTEELSKDTVKDQADLTFSDIIIPRIGAKYAVNQDLKLTAGFSYDLSPLDSSSSDNVNLFDNDRMVFAGGASYLMRDTRWLAYPLRVDAGYQYHNLIERDFTLTASDAPVSPYESITTGGNAHVFSFSVSMNF